MSTEKNSKITFIFIMLLFGTIGVVSHFIPMNSATIVFYRSSIAFIFLILFSKGAGRKYNFSIIKKNLLSLTLISIFLGLNWVFQFESFKVASVSVGTVCYNTMPIFLIILSPIWFNEKITLKNYICIFIALIGIIFVSNVIITGVKEREIIGCIYGLIAALFYALTVLLNRKLKEVDCYDKITFEFLVAAIIMMPYILLNKNYSFTFFDGTIGNTLVVGFVCLFLLGFLHTGIGYIFYFDVVNKLKSNDIAIFTYIDPLFALILSVLILHESLNVLQIIGAILILLSTIINEFYKGSLIRRVKS